MKKQSFWQLSSRFKLFLSRAYFACFAVYFSIGLFVHSYTF